MIGSCEHNNENTGFKKDAEYLDLLSYYQLLRKESASCRPIYLNQLVSYIYIYTYINIFVQEQLKEESRESVQKLTSRVFPS